MTNTEQVDHHYPRARELLGWFGLTNVCYAHMRREYREVNATAVCQGKQVTVVLHTYGDSAHASSFCRLSICLNGIVFCEAIRDVGTKNKYWGNAATVCGWEILIYWSRFLYHGSEFNRRMPAI